VSRLTRPIVLAALVLVLVPGTAQARDAVVTSFDGTPIVTHFLPASGLQGDDRAPTIMLGHGWGGTGESNPNGGSAGPFVREGYNVLTWDARGFGGSGGTVMIDHPDFEGRDVQALIDFVANQPEAKLDAPGDPRVGMSGPSYGGGIQLVTAGLDDRVDAIAPTIAWNSLRTSLFRNDAVKLGWGAALVGLGVAQSVAPGILSPAGIQTGHQSDQFYDTTAEGIATGRVSEENKQWFAAHGPDFLLDRIDVPTLILQGEPDTLFTLDEAHRNYVALADNGIPLKMMWFCGGHAVCLTGNDSSSSLIGDSRRAQEARLAWFARYLANDKGVGTGPAFEWIDENGAWHSSDGYPLTEVGKLEGIGSGQLPLAAQASTAGSGFLVAATPSPVAVSAAIPTPAEPVHVLGEPKLSMTYSGTAAPAETFVYAQIVDSSRDIVVNNLATPIPVTLDGEVRSISLPLERIASLSTAAGYELQIIPSTNVYDVQRATGFIDVSSAHVELPVSEPVSTGGGGADCTSPQKGTKGPDEIKGTSADDAIAGGPGRDRIKGRGGDDCLAGQAGGDRLRGGWGRDLVRAGRGRDRLRGGLGRDELRAVGGGRDVVRCGPGRDRAKVGRGDRVRGCERVKRR
jgi:ABC-2 type transport system ATP-binding protein